MRQNITLSTYIYKVALHAFISGASFCFVLLRYVGNRRQKVNWAIIEKGILIGIYNNDSMYVYKHSLQHDAVFTLGRWKAKYVFKPSG